MSAPRIAQINRKTKETAIDCSLNVDGTGVSEISTGIGFFDHMLDLFARHGLFDLRIFAQGDLNVDSHHTVEDTGIVLGQAFARALGEKCGIRRYGSACLPMDEALAFVALDLSGRPFLACAFPERAEAVPGFPFQLLEEFLRAFSIHSATTIHARLDAGRDSHHMIEAVFKALARALDEASCVDPRVEGIPSTKGVL
jgi:imidazoleglycerol-phosphate dehydratase